MEPNCEKCKLLSTCKSPKMLPDERHLAKTGFPCDILVVGEAPGAEEDSKGVPFVGQSGTLLRNSLRESEASDKYGVVFTNVVHCRPPENASPSVHQIKYCLPLLQGEIEKYNPKAILLLGNTPLKAVLGENGITNWQGVLIEKDSRIYMPMWHPAYVLRNPAAIVDFGIAIENVVECLDGGGKKVDVVDKYELFTISTEVEARQMQSYLLSCKQIAFDTESNIGVDPFKEGTHPILVSFAGEYKAYCVVLNASTIPVVLEVLQSSVPKVLHNSKYDDQVVFAEWGIHIENIVGDTMLLSYTLDSTPGRHGLKELAGRYLGMYEYDLPLRDYYSSHREADPSKGGDMSKVPLDILTAYSALDAVATLELHKALYAEADKPQLAVYENILIPGSRTLGRIECNGVMLDREEISYYRALYSSVQKQIFTRIMKDPTVTRYLADTGQATFNINSPVQMKALLFDKKYLGLKPGGTTEKGDPSTGWDSIKGYADTVQFVKDYHYYKLLGKMLSTYIIPAEGWLGKDGRCHSNYLLHGTATGRLASRNPNLQNIPTPEKEPDTLLAVHPIKNLFTHTWDGGCLLAVDYSGMELRTMASVAGVEGMLAAFREGKDVHSVVTCALFHYTYDEFIAKKKAGDQEAISQRYRAKWVNWTLLYGGSAHTLMSLYGLPEDEANTLVKKYYTMFPEILSSKDKVIKFARQHKYVESKFGRRRYLPGINDSDGSKRSAAEREAVNMPIQSAASDILVCGLIVIQDLLEQNRLKTLLVNTVHDSAMFDVYPGELEDVAFIVKDVLENVPTKYGPEWFPGLDFSWFTCPLEIDMEVGHHYGALEHYKPE